jgi:hypothetical protein
MNHDDMTIMTDFQEFAYAPACGESFRNFIIIIISSWPVTGPSQLLRATQLPKGSCD